MNALEHFQKLCGKSLLRESGLEADYSFAIKITIQ